MMHQILMTVTLTPNVNKSLNLIKSEIKFSSLVECQVDDAVIYAEVESFSSSSPSLYSRVAQAAAKRRPLRRMANSMKKGR